MAEINKKESGKMVGALLKSILGLGFLAAGIWAAYSFRNDLITLIKGCLGPLLVLVGIVTLAIAKD